MFQLGYLFCLKSLWQLIFCICKYKRERTDLSNPILNHLNSRLYTRTPCLIIRISSVWKSVGYPDLNCKRLIHYEFDEYSCFLTLFIFFSDQHIPGQTKIAFWNRSSFWTIVIQLVILRLTHICSYDCWPCCFILITTEKIHVCILVYSTYTILLCLPKPNFLFDWIS